MKKKRLVLILALGVSFAPAVFAADITDDLMLSSTPVLTGQVRPSAAAIHGCPYFPKDKYVASSEVPASAGKAATVVTAD
jgi:hypothetical protein